MTHKPLKRSPELTPLSREHHDGLLLCWKIRTGLQRDVEPLRISSYVLHFYAGHLRRHFDEEEQLVFSVLPDGDDQKALALRQHAVLHAQMARLQLQPAQAGLLQEIAGTLEEHIRFEERKLFPYIEEQLEPDRLQAIGAAIARLHQEKITDDWNDPFWLNKN